MGKVHKDENCNDEEYKDDEVIGADENDSDDKENYNQEDLVRMSSNVRSVYISTTVAQFLHEINSGLYVIPAFQRRYVWNKKKVAQLAFSLIKNVPIPAFYVYIDGDKRYVLDGQQRLISLFLYFNDLEHSGSDNEIEFGVISEINNELRKLEKNESVEKLSSEQKKRVSELKKILRDHKMRRCNYSIKANEGEATITFGGFEKRIQDFLLSQELHIILLECKDKEPNKTYAYLFNILNTAGKRLGSQEIRNGVYWETDLYKKLFKINKNETWRKIYGNVSVYSKDVEILLKALALLHFSQPGINNKGNEVIIIKHTNFSWRKIIEDYSAYAVTNDVSEEIEQLEKFIGCIQLNERMQQIASLKKAAFEAAFVACTLSKVDWEHCTFDNNWFENLYSKLGKIESNKRSVESRLTEAYRIVREDNGII